MPAIKKRPLPKAPAFAKMIGPSFIFLGLGLGSGELIVWPYLISNYGMGIIWAALLGLTLQFFMNMEIERYALVKGESIFVGYWRKAKWLPLWFLLSTFVPWLWPGLVMTSARVTGIMFNVSSFDTVIAMGMLVLIGVILSLGESVYKTVEGFQKKLIFIRVPFVFALSLLFLKLTSLVDFSKGLAGFGDGYWLLPTEPSGGLLPSFSIPLATFLAGLAYSGAGGNLNLSQSFYIRDKGYGMGKYAERISSLFASKKPKNLKLTGTTFPSSQAELNKFNRWWKVINLEHATVFWAMGTVTIVMLCLLAYNTLYGREGIGQDLDFLVLQADVIKGQFGGIISWTFLLAVATTLFATQLTVFDATSRIMAENLSLLSPKMFPSRGLSMYYYAFLWLMIVAGIGVLAIGFNQPLTLIILAASLNAVAMFVHSGLTLWVNKTLLWEKVQPNAFRSFALGFACLFFGLFSLLTLLDQIGVL